MNGPVSRRAFLGAGAMVAVTGCYERVRNSGDERTLDWESLNVLSIESGETHAVAAGDGKAWEGIEWEVDSVLELEPDGEIELVNVGDTE